MPRLLIVTTVPMTIQGFLLPFARAFRRDGWRVDAAANGASDCADLVEAFDRVWDVRWTRSANPAEVPAALHRVRRIVTEGQYDIVHVHTPVAAFITRMALRHGLNGSRPVVIYTAHGFHFHAGSSFTGRLLFTTLEKLAGRWTDYLVVINREDEKAARCQGLLPSDRIVYMPGIGVDISALRPETVSESAVTSFRAELGVRAGDVLFSMLANFDARKRHCDAIRSLAKMERKDVYLVFAGAGADCHLRALAGELGVADRVHFLGYRRDGPVLIRAATATVLPSTREGLSRSVMESMALAVPVIGTDIRGIRDLIDSGAGIIVPPKDVAALCEAMTWVAGHPVQASSMGALGRQQISKYDVRNILEMHRALYDRALGAKGVRTYSAFGGAA